MWDFWWESAKLRSLRSLVPHVPRALCALVSYVPRALRSSCPMCSLDSRASCHVLACSRALCFTCPVPYIASCLVVYESFFLRTLFSRTLRTLWPNITFCVLEFLSFMLLFFCLFVTCYFRGELTKFTTNIVGLQYFKITISIYQQYDKLDFLKPNTKHLHTKLQIILVQVKVNLKLGITSIKSYSQRIDETANTFRT